MSKRLQVSHLLDQLTLELKLNSLWDAEKPSQQDLASTQPFCVDTLNFSQWLQWVMIPRLQLMIEQDIPLPDSSAIHPYAEEALQGLTLSNDRLLILLKRLDETLSQKVMQ